MRLSEIRKEHIYRLWYIFIYLFAAFVYLRLNTVVARQLLNFELLGIHNNLINGTHYAPLQYRLISFYFPELLHRVLPISIKLSYMIPRYIWISLSLIIFHQYLKKWFTEKISHIGTLYFCVIIFWTIRSNIQESEPLNIFIFILSMLLIIEEKYYILLLIIIIGSFNKLTIIFIPAAYFLYNFKRVTFWKLTIKTILLFLPVFAICGGLRYYFRNNPYQCELIQLHYNFSSIFFIAKPIILYNLFWILPFISFKSKPIFLRRVSLIVPVFVVLHFIIGIVFEVRLFLPLAPILIPMGLLTIFNGTNHLRKQPD